ncbi:MAG: hypothetical protein ABI388_10655, partial [Bacteroidia bacterium]
NYMPFYSNTDANNHVLNSFLSNVCFHLFGSSPFSLRLPNLLGYLILIFATYKISKHVQQVGSKIFITTALLFSFHWLSFFSACRGYGLSMALLTMSIAALLDYINNTSNRKLFVVTLLLFQLAMSANLILIIVVALLSVILLIIQLANKKLFTLSTIIIWLLHFMAVYYWLSFSFYLQDKGALYYGAGESYWKVTFVTLLDLLIGFSNPAIKYTLVSFFVITLLLTVYINKNNFLKILQQLKKPSSSLLMAFVLSSLAIGFYLMHKLMHVNYPEDRTGLFFYLFFVLLICFTFDRLPFIVNSSVLLFISLVIIIHFACNVNFRKHSLSVYETIPQHFYDTLVKEQNKSSERITIGGHRVRELFYGFMNYRNGGYLNPADPTEVMQMNCDYYIARNGIDNNYQNYYDVIDSEPDWGFVLLKRKEKIKRILLSELKSNIVETEDEEFKNVYAKTDTTTNINPVVAELNFDIKQIPVPSNIWMVLQINDSAGQVITYKRYPLYWSGDDLNQRKNLSYSLTSGNLPLGAKTIVCYFWNIKKEPFIIKVNSFKLYQLEGKGIDYVAPDIK